MKALAGATLVTPDLDAAIFDYAASLGYRGAVDRVNQMRALSWGCPEAEGARMATLFPESGERRFIRLVEGMPAPSYKPFLSVGWNAIEIVVENLDLLAARLETSPFPIIGPPATLDLGFTDSIRAMQVVGSGGEVLYLTEIAGEIPGFDLPKAKSFVGQPFIMVLGGTSIEQAGALAARLGRPSGPVIKARVGVISDVYDLSPGTRHSLATVPLDDQSLVELDALPKGAGPRPLSSVGLPSGIAIATFQADETSPDGVPVLGRYEDDTEAVTVFTGDSGEMIELVKYK